MSILEWIQIEEKSENIIILVMIIYVFTTVPLNTFSDLYRRKMGR